MQTGAFLAKWVLPSICTFSRSPATIFHWDGVDLTHIIVPPEFWTHDPKAANAKAERPQAPTLVSACTSTVSPPAGTLHQFEMQTDCGKAFTLTENRAPLGQWSKCVIAIYRQSAPSLSTPKKPKLHAAGIVSDLGDNAGAITQDVVTYCRDWPSTYLVARRPLTVLRERPTNPEFLI